MIVSFFVTLDCKITGGFIACGDGSEIASMND